MTDMFIPDEQAIAEAAATASASGFPHLTVLLEAVQAGAIGLVLPNRVARLSSRQLRRANIPTIVLIGDDDYQSTGPAGWRCAGSILEWTKRVTVHAAGATLSEYRAAVYSCLKIRRLTVVETSSSMAGFWTQHFASKSIHVDLIVPRTGAHPIIPRTIQ